MHSKIIKNKRTIYLLCSPGIGLADTWLPVIWELKKKNFSIIFVFPEMSSLALVDDQDQLFKISEKLVDGVLFRVYSGEWVATKNLYSAYKISQISNFDKFYLKFTNRLKNGRISVIPGFPYLGKAMYLAFKFKEILKNKVSHGPYILSNRIDFFGKAFAILYDATVEKKPVNHDFLTLFKTVKKFSMFHGIGATWNDCDFPCNKGSIEKFPREDLTVFPFSLLEVDGYLKCFNLDRNNVFVPGIVRHDKRWIEYIIKNSRNAINTIPFESFIFLISRPASPFNPVDRKLKALKDIYDVICKKLGKKIIIKKHPKEDLNGVDGKLYNEAFGSENYNITWCYSNLHPLLLGTKCEFGISFFSGVPIDLIALGKPTVEYLNLNCLDRFDNKDSLRDKNGDAVFMQRYAGLVLGSSSREQFELHVDNIISDYDNVALKLRKQYDKYFPYTKNSASIVAENIVL